MDPHFLRAAFKVLLVTSWVCISVCDRNLDVHQSTSSHGERRNMVAKHTHKQQPRPPRVMQQGMKLVNMRLAGTTSEVQYRPDTTVKQLKEELKEKHYELNPNVPMDRLKLMLDSKELSDDQALVSSLNIREGSVINVLNHRSTGVDVQAEIRHINAVNAETRTNVSQETLGPSVLAKNFVFMPSQGKCPQQKKTMTKEQCEGLDGQTVPRMTGLVDNKLVGYDGVGNFPAPESCGCYFDEDGKVYFNTRTEECNRVDPGEFMICTGTEENDKDQEDEYKASARTICSMFHKHKVAFGQQEPTWVEARPPGEDPFEEGYEMWNLVMLCPKYRTNKSFDAPPNEERDQYELTKGDIVIQITQNPNTVSTWFSLLGDYKLDESSMTLSIPLGDAYEPEDAYPMMGIPVPAQWEPKGLEDLREKRCRILSKLYWIPTPEWKGGDEPPNMTTGKLLTPGAQNPGRHDLVSALQCCKCDPGARRDHICSCGVNPWTDVRKVFL